MKYPRLPSSSSSRRFAVAAPWLSLLLLACASTTAQPPQASPPPAPTPALAPKGERADALFPPIQALVGEARCTSDNQCRTIGVGHKSCGGPAAYLAWSTQSTPDEAALKRAVDRHAGAQAAEQERSGMRSNCMLVTDPGARCVASRCKLNEGGSAGTGAQ